MANPFGQPDYLKQPDAPQPYSIGSLLDPASATSIIRPQSYESAYGSSEPPVYSPPTSAAAPSGPPGGLTAQFANTGKMNPPLVSEPSTVAQPGQQYGISTQPGETPATRYDKPATLPNTGESGLAGFLQGLVGQFTGALPPDLQQQVQNGMGTIGNILSIPFNIIGNLPQIPLPQFYNKGPGGLFPTKQQYFQGLPETPEKARAEQAANADPTDALYYISQYFKYNETEIAHGLGVSPLIADYFVPTNNLGDQVMQTLGLLGMPSRVVERTYAASQLRNVQQTVINADPSTLGSLESGLRQSYLDGKITLSDVYDELARNGGGFSNSPWDNMLWEMITDPMNITVVGGIAEKIAASSARLEAIGNSVRIGMETLPDAEKVAMNTYAANKYIDRMASQGVTATMDEALNMARDPHRAEWLAANGHNDLIQQGYDMLPRKKQLYYQFDPVIQAAANVGKVVNAPFDLFGQAVDGLAKPFRNGDKIAAFSSRKSVEGVVSAYGIDNVLPIREFFRTHTGDDTAFSDALGRVAANEEAQNSGRRLGSMVKEAGGTPPSADPNAIVRAQSEVANDRTALEIEAQTRRHMDQYLPTARTGKQAIEDEMARQRQIVAQKLGELVGPSADMAEVQKFVGKLNNDQLAFVNHMYFAEGAAKTLLEAKASSRAASSAEIAAVRSRVGANTTTKSGNLTRGAARLKGLENKQELFDRATVIGPRTLTFERAQKVLRSAQAKDVGAVRDAVEQFSQLYDNFAARGLTDEELTRDVSAYLQDLMGKGKGDALVKTIDRNKLTPELRQWADHQKDLARRAGQSEAYQIGLAPDAANRWRPVYAADGRLIGVNPWVDHVADAATVPNLNKLSGVRAKLFAPIRGERILEEARRNFREYGVREWGLSRAEANDFFSAIRRTSNEKGVMPRGLTSGELSDLAGRMGLTDEMMQKVGQRGLARLVAKAFEGDAMTVGITQKLSGKLKTFGANRMGNNFIGVVAERLYPLARFSYNPIFLLQEAAEPFFWNIVKGIKPGMHWTKEDIRSMESLRRSGFLGDWADQWEYSPGALMLWASQESRRIAGGGSALGQAWGNFIGEGRRVASLAELKRLNYIRNVNRNFGRTLQAAFNDMNPAFWDELAREAGTRDAGRIANYYWMSKALWNPDDPHTQTWLMDATIPQTMGKASPIRMQPLARYNNFVDANGLRAAVKSGSYTEAQFRAAMDVVKADPMYVDRAWSTINHVGKEKWWDSYINARSEQLGNTTAAIRQARNEATNLRKGIIQPLSSALGIEEDEFLATRFANPVKFLNSSRLLPKGAKYQILSNPEVLKSWYGHEVLAHTDPVIQRIAREAQAISGPLGERDSIALTLAEKKLADSTLTQTERNSIEQAMATRGITPTGTVPSAIPSEMQMPEYDQFVQSATDTLGGMDQVERAALAHRQTAPMMEMLTRQMPDDVVWRLTEDHIAQPFDYHWHRLRIQNREADNYLSWTGQMLGSHPTDIRGVLNQRNPQFGSNFFLGNKNRIEHAGFPLKAEPESGAHYTYNELGYDTPQHMFAYYDENGDLAATAWVTNHDRYMLDHFAVPGRPGESNVHATVHERDLVNEPLPTSQVPRPGALPNTNQPYVETVGVREDARGKGYYGKMADYVNSEGTFNWADITGRGEYTQQGSAAAMGWLAKRDHESLQQAREAIASRMLAGLASMTGERGMSAYDALSTLQGAVGAMAGLHPGNANRATELAQDFLDMARYPVDPLYEVLGNDVQLTHSFQPNWAQNETLNAFIGGDSIVPTAGRDALAHAYMRNTYRNWAEQANGAQLLGRSDWKASDMQAIDEASIRSRMGNEAAALDPFGSLNQRAASINYEIQPHPGTIMANAFPRRDILAKYLDADSMRAFDQGYERVSADNGKMWASKLGDITGVNVVGVSTGPVNHTVAAFREPTAEARRLAEEDIRNTLAPSQVEALKQNDQYQSFVDDWLYGGQTQPKGEDWQALGPGNSIVVTGTDDQIAASVAATGATWQRGEVIATYPVSDTSGAALDHSNGWGHLSATDFILSPTSGMTERELALRLDDHILNKWMGAEGEGYMTVLLPDGRRAIRVLHDNLDTYIDPTAALDAHRPIGPTDMTDFTAGGIEVKRQTVRAYRHRVDLEDAQTRQQALGDFYNKEGQFYDQQQRVLHQNGNPWAWESERDWHTSGITDPYLQSLEAAGFGPAVTAIRNRYRGEAIAHANESYWRHLPDELAQHRALDETLPPVLRGWHYQRGPTGAIRGATHMDARQQASMFLMKHAGLDTSVHEIFHSIVPILDDSMIKSLGTAYSKATGKRIYLPKNGLGRPRLSDAAEEWASEEFVKYATTGKVSSAPMQAAFNWMAKVHKAESGVTKLAEANPAAGDIFRKLLGQPDVSHTAVHFDPDEWRYLATARYLLGAAEDAAHKTHYFARGRNLLERSVNHPYLGYYPASYMWGKVVPEMLNFLIREPFGIRAPMWGYAMAGHVAQAVALQLNTDQQFADFVKNHPKLIQFVMMMLPGTPWDIPVNAPAWIRHTAQVGQGNQVLAAQGKPQKGNDVLGTIADTGDYALGLLRFLHTGQSIAKEINPPPKAASTTGLTGAQKLAQYQQMWAQSQAGLSPQEQDVNSAASILNGLTPPPPGQ